MRTTSLQGLQFLHDFIASSQEKLDGPDVIYSDASHLKGETMLELKYAWKLLRPGGVLFGDDFNLNSVKYDLIRFVDMLNANR